MEEDVKLPLPSGLRLRVENWSAKLATASAQLSGLLGGATHAAQSAMADVLTDFEMLLLHDSQERARLAVFSSGGAEAPPVAEIARGYDRTMELEGRPEDADRAGGRGEEPREVRDLPRAQVCPDYARQAAAAKARAQAFKAGRSKKRRRKKVRR